MNLGILILIFAAIIGIMWYLPNMYRLFTDWNMKLKDAHKHLRDERLKRIEANTPTQTTMEVKKA